MVRSIRISHLLTIAALASVTFCGGEALARSSYFTTKGCKSCHSESSVTCNGCHYHSGTLSASLNKSTPYHPRETVTVTLTASGARPGWISARLYDGGGKEIARTSGDESGKGGSAFFPAVISVPAPSAPGKYVWNVACFGNNNGRGMGDVHREKTVKVALTVAGKS